MLDMTFQLLAFCMCSFSPPSVAEGQMDMYLPTAGVAKAQAPEEVDPFAITSAEVEPPAEITVAVTSDNGALGKIVIREKEKTTPVADVKALREELTKIRGQVGNAT